MVVYWISALNRFGQIAVVGTALALGLLLIGGREYAMYAGLLGAIVLAAVVWAMRGDHSEPRSHNPRGDQPDEDQRDREKEVEGFEDGFA